MLYQIDHEGGKKEVYWPVIDNTSIWKYVFNWLDICPYLCHDNWNQLKDTTERRYKLDLNGKKKLEQRVVLEKKMSGNEGKSLLSELKCT